MKLNVKILSLAASETGQPVAAEAAAIASAAKVSNPKHTRLIGEHVAEKTNALIGKTNMKPDMEQKEGRRSRQLTTHQSYYDVIQLDSKQKVAASAATKAVPPAVPTHPPPPVPLCDKHKPEYYANLRPEEKEKLKRLWPKHWGSKANFLINITHNSFKDTTEMIIQYSFYILTIGLTIVHRFKLR